MQQGPFPPTTCVIQGCGSTRGIPAAKRDVLQLSKSGKRTFGQVDRAPSHAATWNSCRPLFQFGTVALDPAPDCRVVRFQDALAEQLFDIAQRERVPKGPAHGAKNQLGLRLPPLEDRRSDGLLHDLFRLPAVVGQSCNTSDEGYSVRAQRMRGFSFPARQLPPSPHRPILADCHGWHRP